jgi:hypothetical protein
MDYRVPHNGEAGTESFDMMMKDVLDFSFR